MTPEYVYVVYLDYYEDSGVMGVFFDVMKAIKCARKLNKEECNRHTVQIWNIAEQTCDDIDLDK